MPPSIQPRTSPSREHARETETDSSKATKNIDTTTTTSAPTTDNLILSTTSPLYSSGIYGPGMGASMYGMGGGIYGAAGMMGSPYSYGGGGMPMGGGPISNMNQFLFSVQNIIFSLGQAVQIVGMNTQALHQLLDTATTMLDHALITFKEMRALDACSLETETDEEQKRRRRLRALRWAMIMGFAYGGYRFLRRMLRKQLSPKRPTLQSSPALQYPPRSYGTNPTQSYAESPYSFHGGGTPMYSPNGYYGGTYGGPY